MDDRTEQVLQLIQSHLKIRNYLTIICYCAIIGGLFIYVFYAVSKTSKTIKLVKQFSNSNIQNYKIEKIMTNPRLQFQYNENQVYYIQAKKAHHVNDEEVTLYDVFATGDIGNITSGKLEVSESGDHLVFTENPVLILNRTENINNRNQE